MGSHSCYYFVTMLAFNICNSSFFLVVVVVVVIVVVVVMCLVVVDFLAYFHVPYYREFLLMLRF